MKQKIVRFEIQEMLPIGLTLVIAGIGIVYGMSVIGDIGSDFCNGNLEHWNQGTCFKCANATHNNFYTNNNLMQCANSTDPVSNANHTAGVAGDAAFNASRDAGRGVAKIPEKMPLIATVIVAAIIIGILVRYLMVRFA